MDDVPREFIPIFCHIFCSVAKAVEPIALEMQSKNKTHSVNDNHTRKRSDDNEQWKCKPLMLASDKKKERLKENFKLECLDVICKSP